MKAKWLISMLLVFALTALGSWAKDETVTYTVTDLGTLGGTGGLRWLYAL